MGSSDFHRAVSDSSPLIGLWAAYSLERKRGGSPGFPDNRFQNMPWSQTPREGDESRLGDSSPAAFPRYEPCRPPWRWWFRGSIPSLALRPALSFPLASRDSLPPPLQGSVLVWWLAFDQIGFSPIQLSELGPAHS